MKKLRYSPTTPWRRSPGGVMLLILRNRGGMTGDNGEYLSLSAGRTLEYSPELKQTPRFD